MNVDELKQSIRRFGKTNGPVPTSFNVVVCECGHNLFHMYSDDLQGGCGIECTNCGEGLSVEGSADYMEDIAQNTCRCHHEALHVVVGKAFYTDSTDVKWVYVGGQCPECGLSGVYVDWHER